MRKSFRVGTQHLTARQLKDLARAAENPAARKVNRIVAELCIATRKAALACEKAGHPVRSFNFLNRPDGSNQFRVSWRPLDRRKPGG